MEKEFFTCNFREYWLWQCVVGYTSGANKSGTVRYRAELIYIDKISWRELKLRWKTSSGAEKDLIIISFHGLQRKINEGRVCIPLLISQYWWKDKGSQSLPVQHWRLINYDATFVYIWSPPPRKCVQLLFFLCFPSFFVKKKLKSCFEVHIW
jgi:hypothetical protein